MFIKQKSHKIDEKCKKLCNIEEDLGNDPKMNFNNHYHLGERNTNSINIMSGFKSLVCDLNGIIIAEMVYRCMICDVIYETIPEIQIHYQTKHIDQDMRSNSSDRNEKTTNLTNVSFFGSFQSTTDSFLDERSEPSTPQTLTFDVPSGLKTLQQRFESTSKEVQSKGKANKPLASGNLKSRSGLTQKSKQVFGQMKSPTIKSGFITCEICGATKFYKYTQRRFGVYSCVGCAKFYSKYLIRPVKYEKCENLGKCNLKVSECEPNGRCKACLIHKCKSKFIIDPKKLTNYQNDSVISQNENKKVSNESKTKSKTKSVSPKESNIKAIKTKTLNTISNESKLKSNSMSTKPKNESENSSSLNKSNNYLTSNKRNKSEKTVQKSLNEKNEISCKKVTNTTNTGNTNKTSVSPKLKHKKTSLKSKYTKPKEKRTRSQSCFKCFGNKTKDCSNCGTGLKAKQKYKTGQKILKRSGALTRTRNK